VLRNAKDEMSQMANASFEQFRDAKLQVSYDVQKAWNDLYRIRYDIKISEKNLEILKIIERLALIRYKTAPMGGQGGTTSGSGITPSDAQNRNTGGSSAMQGMSGNQGGAVASPSPGASAPMQQSGMESSSGSSDLVSIYRIQIESGDLRNSIELLRSEEKTAVALFNSYLNRSPEMPVITGDTLLTENIDYALESGRDSINSNNPMLRMIGYERQSYEARKKMVTGMGYPMVGVGINYSIIKRSEMSTSDMNGKDMVMPMVSVTLPVYRKKYRAMKKEADLLGTAAAQNYQATANSLQTEYYRAVQQYQDSQRRLKLYNEQHQLASKTFEIMLKSFSATSTNLTDVLRVRQQMHDYEINKVGALTDLNTAAAGLKRLMATSSN
jgi:outer membrane protein TolC